MERQLHGALGGAGHTRLAGGREWFSTTIEFCDEIARLLGLEILGRES